VNGQSFEHGIKYSRALEILRGVCHLSITLKSNLLAYQDMLHTAEDSQRSGRPGRKPTNSSSSLMESSVDGGGGLPMDCSSGYGGSLSRDAVATGLSASTAVVPLGKSKRELVCPGMPGMIIMGGGGPSHGGGRFLGISSKQLLNRAFNRFLSKPKALHSSQHHLHDAAMLDDVSITGGGGGSTCNSSAALFPVNNMSSCTLESREGGGCHSSSSEDRSEYPEHVLRVYKADQTFKYLLVHKETTAHEVVMLSLQEFGITEPSTNFTLCEVSVAEGGFVKQRTLPDQLKNLAERIGLASRYYIKNIHDSDSLLPDECVTELQKEAHVTLLQLNPVEVSTQIMVEDFTIFRQIEATEYVEDLFEIRSRYGTPNLSTFSALVNREMMWVVSEIVSEPSVHKRMRVLKQFIKIARQCKETQNFNSMFAIVSGLGHGSVTRLKSTWEKLPSKYQRLFTEMQQLMDPSRNMSRYRNLVNSENVQPPIIPFYPVVKKDLTFIHLGNHSVVDGLINFEKLRMIAKEVSLCTR
jgi:Rap guanine nucleotide exchange factor 2